MFEVSPNVFVVSLWSLFEVFSFTYFLSILVWSFHIGPCSKIPSKLLFQVFPLGLSLKLPPFALIKNFIFDLSLRFPLRPLLEVSPQLFFEDSPLAIFLRFLHLGLTYIEVFPLAFVKFSTTPTILLLKRIHSNLTYPKGVKVMHQKFVFTLRLLCRLFWIMQTL